MVNSNLDNRMPLNCLAEVSKVKRRSKSQHKNPSKTLADARNLPCVFCIRGWELAQYDVYIDRICSNRSYFGLFAVKTVCGAPDVSGSISCLVEPTSIE
jgi:hypothetical protein